MPNNYLFLCVVFGPITSPFLSNATVKHHLSKYLTKCKYFIDTFLSDLYNDNSTFGFGTVSIVYDIYLKAKSM